MRAKGMAESSISNYSSQIKSFLIHFKHVEKCRLITSEQIIEYLTTKIQSNTRRHAHSAIKLFYTNIVKQPMKFRYIPYAKKERKLPQPLEVCEIKRMMSVCNNTKHKVILYILYGCGLRIGELINLKWSHIDRSAGIIYIIQGKGKKDRKVMLFPELISLLENYYKEYKSECRLSPYILKGQKAHQYSQTSINNVLKSIAKKAGIKRNVHAHIFRHSHASHLLESGIDLRTIQELLGHENFSTTTIYTHVSKKRIASIPSPVSLMLGNVA